MQIAAADVLLGKIGYGTVSECLAHSTPLVFVRRDYFNEEPFLRRLLQLHGAAVEIRRRDFLDGTWAPFLLHAAELRFSYKCVQPHAIITCSLRLPSRPTFIFSTNPAAFPIIYGLSVVRPLPEMSGDVQISSWPFAVSHFHGYCFATGSVDSILISSMLKLKNQEVVLMNAAMSYLNSGPTNGAEVVASKLVAAARRSSHGGPLSANGSAQGPADMHAGEGGPQRAGSVRLRDAIVWGYMMQRHDARAKVSPADLLG